LGTERDLLGFDDGDELASDEEGVVGGAVGRRVLGDGVGVELGEVCAFVKWRNGPTRSFEPRVDALGAGFSLGFVIWVGWHWRALSRAHGNKRALLA
jgi:hypothetical protein